MDSRKLAFDCRSIQLWTWHGWQGCDLGNDCDWWEDDPQAGGSVCEEDGKPLPAQALLSLLSAAWPNQSRAVELDLSQRCDFWGSCEEADEWLIRKLRLYWRCWLDDRRNCLCFRSLLRLFNYALKDVNFPNCISAVSVLSHPSCQWPTICSLSTGYSSRCFLYQICRLSQKIGLCKEFIELWSVAKSFYYMTFPVAWTDLK